MNAVLAIRVQKLFAVAVSLKLISAFFGWYLQMQWELGLALPLLVMCAYIALGANRKDREVTDEKFADSCYYLGFIFTIASIIFSLFDLPSIGEHIQEIAVRFGAAMISTVFGLTVRVYLVSFRPDSTDALHDAEDAVLDAAQKFREQLLLAHDKVEDFQAQVFKATEASVDRAKLQVEQLAADHSKRMEQVFLDLNERNQQAVTSALDRVSAASERMASSVDAYAMGMQTSLQSLETKVGDFGEAVTARLKATTFPDDFFASQLSEPLRKVRSAAVEVSRNVEAAAAGTSQAAKVLSATIRKLNTKVEQADASLDSIVRLTTAQDLLIQASEAQLDRLNAVAAVMADQKASLERLIDAVGANSTSNSEVKEHVTKVVAAIGASHRAVEIALGRVAGQMAAERLAATALSGQVQNSEVATNALVAELSGASLVAKLFIDKLDAESAAKLDLGRVIDVLASQQASVSQVLANIDSKTAGVSSDVQIALAQLKAVSERLQVLVHGGEATTLPRQLPETPTVAVLEGPPNTPRSDASSMLSPSHVGESQLTPARIEDQTSAITYVPGVSEPDAGRANTGPE